MRRILIFHGKEPVGNEVRLGATYHLDADYEPVAVRIYAGSAPEADAKIDIFANGVSVFADNASKTRSAATGYNTPTPVTTATLNAGENGEPYAEDFAIDEIAKGSWIYCNLVDTGGGENFTVQFELNQLSEDTESED